MAVTQDTINKAKELNKQYKAGEISADEVRNQMADAYYARDPAKLQNADVNVSKYGDDHSPENYNDPEMWGGENQKYTGENTKNSYTAYDPNATTEGLNPNYQYGRNAQMANSEQANYIANRNDQIASALYNEGKTSIEDVANFLRTQRGFDNSTENERQNTINSVWKRIGQMAQENGNKDTENSNGPTDQNNDQALQNMQDDLMKDTSGKLYGKVSADETEYGNAINTVADPYSVDRMMAESRVANVKRLQTMSSEDIATSITGGYTPYGDQAMRDLMQYNPEKYAEVQQFIKQQKGQNSINSITTGDVSGMNTTQTSIDNVNNGVDSWADGLSSSPQQAGQLVTNISSTMANNGVATTATQEMLNLNAQMADIQEKMANVKKDAQKAFKGDVPQYIVDAYANNRLQEYQSQYNKLESRYNAAMDLYKTELDNAKRKEEMNLKYLQYQQGVSESNWKQYYQSMQLKQDSIKRVNGKAYQMNYDGTMTQISDTTAYTTYQKNTSQLLQGYIAQYTNGGATKTANGYKYNISGGQCEAFTDNFTEAATGLRMTGANGRGRTTAEEKIGYINSFTPEVGSVAVAVGGAYDSTYGHTMLVTGYDPTTQTVDLLWSNNGGDEMVYSSSMSLSQLMNSGVKGFRNPYYDMAAQSASQGGTGRYQYYATPMQSFFEEAYENATVASERADIQAAQDSYSIMYELQQGGYLDKLANSDEFNTLLSQIANGKFSDSSGNVNFSKIGDYARNKLKDEDIAYAMDRFHRLIEKKLRKESGAAISQSEWNSNFDMYLPAVGQTPEYRYKRLEALERDIVAAQLPPKYRADYIPIMGYSATREIR